MVIPVMATGTTAAVEAVVNCVAVVQKLAPPPLGITGGAIL